MTAHHVPKLFLSKLLAGWLILTSSIAVWSQTETGEGALGASQVIPLYPDVAPGSENWNYSEKIIQGKSGPQVRNVVRPTLLYFPAAQPNGTAMIVAPGGGTRTLMMSYEGVDIARRLNKLGVDAFVLKYRLLYDATHDSTATAAGKDPQAGQDVRALAAADGQRAMEIVRYKASEFKYRADRIGMIGFSAGGGPVRAAIEGGSASQPNFAALIYAGPSRDGQILVPENAPPLFLAVAADDRLLDATLDTFMAWKRANKPVELHVFQMGAHGFVNRGGGADHFMDRLAEWLHVNLPASSQESQ
jgi:acetyl esterase/lipase